MIKVEDLFRTSHLSMEQEVKRLEGVNGQISTEPYNVRTALGYELLAIIRNPDANLEHRVLAPFILARHANDFDFFGSREASALLTNVLHSEFYSEEKSRFLKKSRRVKHLSPPEVAFFDGIIAALIAIDPEQGYEALSIAYKDSKDPSFKEHLWQIAKCRGITDKVFSNSKRVQVGKKTPRN